MTLRYILMSLAIISLVSCSDGPEVNNYDLVIRNGAKYLRDSTEPFTGIGIVERDAKGRRFEITYKNGVQHGSSSIYSPDGLKEHEAVYDKGVKTFSTSWYPSGVRSSYTKYTGKYGGIEETWYPNGKKMSIAKIQYGRVVPESQTLWDKNGNVVK